MNNKKQIIYTYKSKRAAEKVRKIKNQRKGRKSFMVKILGGSLGTNCSLSFWNEIDGACCRTYPPLRRRGIYYIGFLNRKYVIHERRCLFYLESLSDRTNTRWHNFFLSFLSH